MGTKSKRQALIREIIEKKDIETQEELACELEKAGVAATQATVSRDIRELNLTKMIGSMGKQKYCFPKQERTFLGDRGSRVLRDGFVSMESAQSLLVIRTASGMAMAVAAAIDDLKLSQIVGCIAGDDTIMAAVRDLSDVETVKVEINKILERL